MNILILHRIPYARIDYHRGIDHSQHQVTYIGEQALIATLPQDLRCTAVVRPGKADSFAEVQAWLEQHPQHFDRVISLSEYELLAAARLRDTYAIPGASVSQVLLTRNKLLMKDAVAASGLRVPRYQALADFLQNLPALPWSGKTVVKPHSGASSVGVEIHASAMQAAQALKRRIADGTLLANAFEVEEFIEGSVRHFDGLIQDGALYEITASQYVGSCHGYMEHGQPLGSFQIEVTPNIRQWVEQALAAVQIRNGSFHLEAIMEGDEPVFLEVGNRVGGAEVVATFEMATGVHLPSQELRIHLGTEILSERAARSQERPFLGWFVYAGHCQQEATFHGLSGAEDFIQHCAVVQWNALRPGADLPRHVTYSAHEAPLSGIVKFANADQTQAWLEDLFSQVQLREASRLD
ncbi:acetyl-CoA carboxylase biotin carboxylase subunit family protein [Pseudomonas sp. NPDC086251]|uniref:ATP-grasp domain-containing protein n=1 Tax=Pseudomonas sp. NPDC086251 TaxID=3364431 RepID=UPI0038326ADF